MNRCTRVKRWNYAPTCSSSMQGFGRVNGMRHVPRHQRPRVTPAMEAGVSDHVGSVEEIVALVTRQ